MVIGERFAWAHIPKTGGDATLALFETVAPDLVLEADPADVPDRKHEGFAVRGPEVARKPVLAANIRRLPDRELSRVHHLFRHGVKTENWKPRPMLSPEEVATSGRADRQLLRYAVDGELRIDVWLRLEHLRDDFRAFVSRFRPLSGDEEARLGTAAPKKNVASYDHDVTHFFTREQIERLYATNPVWASVEERVYGDLAIPEEAHGREPGASEAWWEPYVRGWEAYDR